MTMSKRNKKDRPTLPKLNKNPKSKKVKKKFKKIATLVKQKMSSAPKEKHNDQDKLKGKSGRKKICSNVTKSGKKLKLTKPSAAFGAVSSESEPELIEPSWQMKDSKHTKDTWKTKPSFVSEKSDISDEDVLLSSDLDSSETDQDEVLEEDELNSLLLRSNAVEHSSDETEESHDSNEEIDNIQEVQQENVTVKHTKDSELAKPPKSTVTPDSSKQECQLSLGNKTELLREIERRSVDLSSRSLYLSPVPSNCSFNLLKQLSPTLLSCRLSYNAPAKSCRKYAFLEYADSQSANRARKSLMGRLFAGRSVSTQPGRPQFLISQGSENIRWNELFVTGLHQTTTKSDLQQVFPKAQEIDYPFHAKGHPLGYAMVKFVNDEVAFEAFVAAHKRPVKGQPIFVNYVVLPPKLMKNTHGTTPSATFPASVPTTPSESNITTVTSELKRSGEHLDDSGHMNKKPKVVIKVIEDPVTNSEMSSFSADILPERNESDNDELFIRPPSKKDDKPSHMLSNLIRSKKAASVNLKPSKLVTNAASLHVETKQDDSDEDQSDHSVSDSCESLIGDSIDPDSATLSEDDDNDEEDEEEEEEDDGEDSGSAVGEEENEEDETETDDDEDSQSNAESVEESHLFQCPPTVEEKRALEENKDLLGEEVDSALGAVIHARRSATRALKTAGSSKKQWSASGFNKGNTIQKPTKAFKPFMLPVPSKRSKA